MAEEADGEMLFQVPAEGICGYLELNYSKS